MSHLQQKQDGSDVLPPQKMLVAFASRTGSTAGVAEAIGEILSQNGASVDVLPMEEVKAITSYEAIVAGSAIQNRQWLPEAMQFMQVHRAELGKRPFAIFTVCMTLAMRDGEKYRPQVAEWAAPVRRLVRPLSEGYFTGALDISKIPSFADRLKFKLSVLMGVWSEGDHRDWNAIHTWTNTLSPLLLPPG